MSTPALDPLSHATPTNLLGGAGKPLPPTRAEPFVQLLLAADLHTVAPPPQPLAHLNPPPPERSEPPSNNADKAPAAESESDADDDSPTQEETPAAEVPAEGTAATEKIITPQVPEPVAEPAAGDVRGEQEGKTAEQNPESEEHADEKKEPRRAAAQVKPATHDGGRPQTQTTASPDDRPRSTELPPAAADTEGVVEDENAPEMSDMQRAERAKRSQPLPQHPEQQVPPTGQHDGKQEQAVRSESGVASEVAESQPAREPREEARRTSKSTRRERTVEAAAARSVPSSPPPAAAAVEPPTTPTTNSSPATTSETATPPPVASTSTPASGSSTPPATTAAPQPRLAEPLVARTQRPAASETALNPAQKLRFVQRVAGAIEAARQRDGHVRLRLSPPELGAIKLEVKVEDGVLSARIEAETEVAKTALVENFPALRDRLAEQGIRVEDFQVDVPDRRDDPSHAEDSPTRDQSRQRPGGTGDRAAREPQERTAANTEAPRTGGPLQQLNVII